jgi:hypothetical protein
VGFEGYYEISDHGHVRSVERDLVYTNGYRRTQPSSLIRGFQRKSGHIAVTLWREGKPTNRLVHQLVAEAFIGPRPFGMHVCHNDGIPDNNHVSNLRIDTPAANAADKVIHGTNRGRPKAISPTVLADILAARQQGDTYRTIAARTGLALATIQRHVRNAA